MASVHTMRGVRPFGVGGWGSSMQAAELGPRPVGGGNREGKGAEQAGDTILGVGLLTYRLWPRSLGRGPGDVLAAGHT